MKKKKNDKTIKTRIMFVLLNSFILMSCESNPYIINNIIVEPFGLKSNDELNYLPCLIDDKFNIEINPTLMNPFNTSINFLAHVKDNESQTRSLIKNQNNNIYYLSMCFDQYNLYCNEQKELLKNVAYFNRQYGSENFIELETCTYQLIKTAYDFTIKTDGLYNFCIGNLSKLWDEYISNADASKMPSEVEIEQAKKNIPSVEEIKKIFTFDDAKHAIKFSRIEDKDIKISLSSAAKGYMTDYLMSNLNNHNILISGGSSSIATYGDSLFENWKIALSNPIKLNEQYIVFKKQGKFSFSTSGDYQNYYIYQNNTRYHHIINPITGYPSTLYRSVSVIGENGTYCDMLSTFLMLISKEEGKKFLKKFEEDTSLKFYTIYSEEINNNIKFYIDEGIYEYIENPFSIDCDTF